MLSIDRLLWPALDHFKANMVVTFEYIHILAVVSVIIIVCLSIKLKMCHSYYNTNTVHEDTCYNSLPPANLSIYTPKNVLAPKYELYANRTKL